MKKITTITELLIESGCDSLIFDLSRRVVPIPHKDFAKIETSQMAYPYPIQRKAHLGIAYWNRTKEPWIWFLTFDLDERGLIKTADIGQFLKYVIEAMGVKLTDTISQKQQEKLANNPYTFHPSEEKQAIFHSHLRASLDLVCSQYYEHAQLYMSGKLGWDNWQSVGLQGISDIGSRLHQEQNTTLVKKALRHLPQPPRYALLGVLEHVTLPISLEKTLIELTDIELSHPQTDIFLLSAYIRSLSGGSTNELNNICKHVLNDESLSHKEVLIAIAGRSSSVLANPELAQQFLIRLAETHDPLFFNQLFADLVMQPSLRHVFLTLLNSDATDELKNALLILQQSTKDAVN